MQTSQVLQNNNALFNTNVPNEYAHFILPTKELHAQSDQMKE